MNTASTIKATIDTTGPKPFVETDGTKVFKECQVNGKPTTQSAANWKTDIQSNPAPNLPDATDYEITWTLTSGEANSAAVGAAFDVEAWSPENFVLVPAAVYDGNRFEIKKIDWPAYWFDPAEWRLDMPSTMSPGPTLGKGPGPGSLRLSTGDAAVPLIGFQSPNQKLGWMVQTTQGSRLGNHWMTLEENGSRSSARVTIQTPAGEWKAGDSLTLHLRVYQFPAATRLQMLTRFMEARKDLNPSRRKEELPFSAAWNLLNALYQEKRWDNNSGFYWASEPKPNRPWCFIWQLGWCGGGQATLPLLIQGDPLVRERVHCNLEMIFSKSQAPSGFFYLLGNGEKFASFGYFKPLKNNETFVRSQGDWLYMAQLQFRQIQTNGDQVPENWKAGLKKQADAFLRVWDKFGQFGQFLNIETGDLIIGGSTSGAILPAGLALASQTFQEPRYLKVAEESARKYYQDFVQLGYTTGGPGEILSAPDSESAFALFESFMVLNEITGSAGWLDYAKDLLPILASWTVSYDYQFPPQSDLGRIDTRSTGAVWANVQNKHGAPGICTWSGDSLLKYFRATGDRRALELLTDIAHGMTQYISRADRPIGPLPAGGICERVNLSAWEGPQNVGGHIFDSCSWVETAALLTVTQLPGVYVQTDTGIVTAFDNVRVEDIRSEIGRVQFRLKNPTKFPADVRILAETSHEARHQKSAMGVSTLPVVHLDPSSSICLDYPATHVNPQSGLAAMHGSGPTSPSRPPWAMGQRSRKALEKSSP